MQPRRVDASAAAVSSVTERYDRPAISRNEPIIRPPLLSSRSLFLSSSFSLFPRLRESIRSDAAAERGNHAAEGARDSGQEMSTRKSNSNLLVPCYRELARPRCNYLAILDAARFDRASLRHVNYCLLRFLLLKHEERLFFFLFLFLFPLRTTTWKIFDVVETSRSQRFENETFVVSFSFSTSVYI